MRKNTLLVVVITSLIAACGDNDAVCDGTSLVDGKCVLVCGPGTVNDNNQCVAIETGAAPSIASINPPLALVGGGTPFTISGSGFLEPGSADTQIVFGTAVASFEIVSDTEIQGTVPFAASRRPEIVLTNGNGSSSVGFEYTGLFAADGKSIEGNLYLIDPRDGAHLTIGAITSDDGETPHGATGLAFDPSGVLFASTSNNAASTSDEAALLAIDIDSAEATVIGLFLENDTDHPSVADLTFLDDTLLGWSRDGDELISVDTGSGAVSVLTDQNVSGNGNGVAALDDGTVIFMPDSVGGDIFVIDPIEGSLESMVTSFSEPFLDGLLVSGMTIFQGAVFAVLNKQGPGSLLALVDLSTGEITAVGPLPTAIDAIASKEPQATSAGKFAPSGPSVTVLERLRQVPACTAGKSGAVLGVVGGRAQRTILATDIAGRKDSVPLAFARRRDLRGLPLLNMLTDFDGASVFEVEACGDEPVSLALGELVADPHRYVLTSNRRGRIKLIDRASGTPILRNVVAVRAK